MSERYASCAPCAGSECLFCGGTGFSGDAMSYRSGQKKFKWRPKPRGYALEAAVLALQEFINRDKKRDMSCEIIPFDSIKNEPRGRRKMSVQNNLQNLPVSNGQESKQVSKHKSEDISLIMEKVILAGDLSKMDPIDRVNYYLKTCESLGMNPMTKPFDLITLNGKMVLYPNRSGGDQLRKIANVDFQIVDKGFDKDTGCYVVTARAKLPSGRIDEDMGIVYCAGLKGDALANAQLKAMTKAKRRVTLGIVGLGWIDESEVSSVKNAKTHKIDLDTGAVTDDPKIKDVESSVDDDPKKVIKPKWVIGESELDLIKLHCNELGWGQKAFASVIEKNFGKSTPQDLTEEEFRHIMKAMGDQVAQKSEQQQQPQSKEPGDDSEDFPVTPNSGLDPVWQKYADKGNF